MLKGRRTALPAPLPVAGSATGMPDAPLGRAMRAIVLLAAVSLLLLSVPAATADPVPPFSPVCPFTWDFATVCVGGVLQCFVSVKLMGGDRYCL